MKKSKKPRFWSVLFWLLMACGLLWLVFAPTRHHHRLASVNVAVTPLEEKPVLPEPPPPPPSPMAEAPTSEPDEHFTEPPVGEERTQPQAVPSAPPVTSHETPKPLPRGEHPMIAIVIDDVGLDLKGSRRAIDLPPQVTLSFMPYARQLRQQTHDAHEQGHELLLHMPMEPIGHDDPGPGALFVNLPPDEIRTRFRAGLDSFSGFDGVNNHMGSRFTADTAGMEIVMDELQQRHLFFFDSRTNAKSVGAALAREHQIPTVSRDVFLDDEITPKAVSSQLQQVEKIAQRKGFAVAIGHPHAITLAALEGWIPDAEQRGFVFVPLRRLIQSPPE